jgi:hypothetical protein
MFEVSKKYYTVGGWEAEVIRHTTKHDKQGNPVIVMLVAHKPDTEDETLCHHDENGNAYASFSVHAPPLFDVPHPATLTEQEINEPAEPEEELSPEYVEIINLPRGQIDEISN